MRGEGGQYYFPEDIISGSSTTTSNNDESLTYPNKPYAPPQTVSPTAFPSGLPIPESGGTLLPMFPDARRDGNASNNNSNNNNNNNKSAPLLPAAPSAVTPMSHHHHHHSHHDQWPMTPNEGSYHGIINHGHHAAPYTPRSAGGSGGSSGPTNPMVRPLTPGRGRVGGDTRMSRTNRLMEDPVVAQGGRSMGSAFRDRHHTQHTLDYDDDEEEYLLRRRYARERREDIRERREDIPYRDNYEPRASPRKSTAVGAGAFDRFDDMRREIGYMASDPGKHRPIRNDARFDYPERDNYGHNNDRVRGPQHVEDRYARHDPLDRGPYAPRNTRRHDDDPHLMEMNYRQQQQQQQQKGRETYSSSDDYRRQRPVDHGYSTPVSPHASSSSQRRPSLGRALVADSDRVYGIEPERYFADLRDRPSRASSRHRSRPSDEADWDPPPRDKIRTGSGPVSYERDRQSTRTPVRSKIPPPPNYDNDLHYDPYTSRPTSPFTPSNNTTTTKRLIRRRPAESDRRQEEEVFFYDEDRVRDRIPVRPKSQSRPRLAEMESREGSASYPVQRDSYGPPQEREGRYRIKRYYGDDIDDRDDDYWARRGSNRGEPIRERRGGGGGGEYRVERPMPPVSPRAKSSGRSTPLSRGASSRSFRYGEGDYDPY